MEDTSLAKRYIFCFGLQTIKLEESGKMRKGLSEISVGFSNILGRWIEYELEHSLSEIRSILKFLIYLLW